MEDPKITGLLHQWQRGNEQAFQDLVPLVYQQLKKIARRHLASERSSLTLRSTELVHEAYLRLADTGDKRWNDRIHFYAVAAVVMRAVLIDHARARKRQKRGGGLTPIVLDEAIVVGDGFDSRVLELDESLNRLAAVDARKAKVVELVFFGGLTQRETAQFLNISDATVERDLKLAKAWLHRDLKHG
jgi:RNA polymerase sigma factor (TIGR02999 family)